MLSLHFFNMLICLHFSSVQCCQVTVYVFNLLFQGSSPFAFKSFKSFKSFKFAFIIPNTTLSRDSRCLLTSLPAFRTVRFKLTNVRHFLQIYSDKSCTTKGKSLKPSIILFFPLTDFRSVPLKHKIQHSFYMRRHVTVFTFLAAA